MFTPAAASCYASFTTTLGPAMIRILLSAALAVGAFFGPWFVEAVRGARTGETLVVRAGDTFAGDTVACLMAGTLSLAGACAPPEALGFEGWSVTAAILLAAASAVLNVLGLLPVVGRLTSLLAVAAGIAGVVAFGAVGFGAFSEGGIGTLRWAAYATGAVGLLLAVVGVRGLGGDAKD